MEKVTILGEKKQLKMEVCTKEKKKKKKGYMTHKKNYEE